MATSYASADFLSGVKDTSQDEPPNTESRTWGGAIGDTLSKVADPLIGLVRAGTTFGREIAPETFRGPDEDVARWQKNLRENLTPYQKAIDTSSYFPEYGQRNAWRDWGPKLLSSAAGLAAPAAIGAATAGVGLGPMAAAGAAGTVFGAQGFGEGLAKQRDFAMETPIAELKKSPVFQKAWIDWQGDETAARDQFYKETRDVTAAVIEGMANGLSYAAIARMFPAAKQESVSLVHRLLSGGAGNAAYRGVQGATESSVASAAMGTAGTYTGQSQRVNAGLQPNVDPREMAHGTQQSMEEMIPPVTALHIFRGRHVKPAPKIDDELPPVLSGQLALPAPSGGGGPMLGLPAPPIYGRDETGTIYGPDLTGTINMGGPAPTAPPGSPPPGAHPSWMPGVGTAPPPGPGASPAPGPTPAGMPPPGGGPAVPAGPAPPPGRRPAAPPAAPPPPVVTPTAPRNPRFRYEPPGFPGEGDFPYEERQTPEPPAAAPSPPEPTAAAAPAPQPSPAGPALLPPPRARGRQPSPSEGTIALPGEVERPAPGPNVARERARAQQETPPVEQGGGETPRAKSVANVEAGAKAAVVQHTADEAERRRQGLPPVESGDFALDPEVRAFLERAAGAADRAEAARHQQELNADMQRRAHRAADFNAWAREGVTKQAPAGRRLLPAQRPPDTARMGTPLGPGAGAKTVVRRSKHKTGMERALEASLDAWKKVADKTAYAWTALRKRIMAVEAARTAAGLSPAGYMRKLGGPPGASRSVMEEVDRIRRFGQQRQPPVMPTNQRPSTPEEKALSSQIERLHQSLGNRQMTTFQYQAMIRPTLAAARRADKQREAEGLAPVFERAMPKQRDKARSLEQQFNDQEAKLELYRDLPPEQFAKHTEVVSALQRMHDINEERIPKHATRQPSSPEIDPTTGERFRVGPIPDVTSFRPEPPITYRRLPIKQWIAEKLAQAPTADFNRLQFENEPYRQAQEELARRRHAATPLAIPAPPVGEHVRARTRALYETVKGSKQKHDIGTITGTSGEGRDVPPMTAAQHEAWMARRRRMLAGGVGELMRQETTPEPLTPERAKSLAVDTLAEQNTANKDERRRGKLTSGELPKYEDLDKLVDEALGKTERAATQQGRQATTREKMTALREEAIKFSIDSVLRRHFGTDPQGEMGFNVDRVRELVDRLQLSLPSGERVQGERSGVTRTGRPIIPPELTKRTRRGSRLSGAELDRDELKKIVAAEASRPDRIISREQLEKLGITLNQFNAKLNEGDRLRLENSESFKQVRVEYERALKEWEIAAYDQMGLGYELKPILDEIIRLADHNIQNQRKQRGYKASKRDEKTGKTSGTIQWALPHGTERRDSRGRVFNKYNAGTAEEKSDHFNMLVDIMNAAETLRLAHGLAPTMDAFNKLKQPEANAILSSTVPELSKLGGDWRAYIHNDLAMVREARRAKTIDIDSEKKSVKPTAVEGEEGEPPIEGEVPDTVPSPEEEMIRREEQGPTNTVDQLIETEYQRKAREKRERDIHQAMVGAAKPEPQKPKERVFGTRAEGSSIGPKLTEDLKPPAGRTLTGEEYFRRKVELEAKRRGETLSEEETTARVQALLANRRNRPMDGPPPETVGAYRAEVHSARDALATDDPVHPLISDPEPASASIDRAKKILESGEHGDVSDFITPEFLDKLSKVNEGVQVLHAPVDVVSGERREGQAFYDPSKDRIVFSNDVSSADYLKNVAHEQTHAAFEHLLNSDARFRAEVDDLRARVQRFADKAGITNERLLYGLKDPHEFLSEAKSNPEFRQLLQRTMAPGKDVISGVKNALNALYKTIQVVARKVMGNKDGDTALDVLFRDTSTVLGHTDKLIAKGLDRLVLEGRKIGPSPEGRRYMPSVAEMVGRARVKVGDTIAGRGRTDTTMDLHTTVDFGHRGLEEFRNHVVRIRKNMAKTATTRQNIIAGDEPKLHKAAKWLNGMTKDTRRKVEKFLIDETMHSAFTDKALSDAANKHIGRDEPGKPASLRDAQVRRMHPEMQRRYEELARTVPEFVENRKALHDFFLSRENQIRHEVTKALIEHLDILPASATTPTARNAAMDLIQKHIIGGKLTPAEKTRLEAIKTEAGRPKFRDVVARIRRTPELNMIAGPYIPLTRHGGWAVFGRFKMPSGGADGERVVEAKDPKTGRPIDDGVRMFTSRAEAEAFEQRMQQKFGMSQLDGGEWFIDKRTGKRAREYTEEELQKLHEDPKNIDLRNRLLRAKEVAPGIVELGPNQYEKRYWVKMQPKVLEFHQSKSTAVASTAAWRAKHGADIEVTNPEMVHRGTGKENEKYASAQMQKLIDRIETTPSYQALNKDEQAALKAALTLQAAKLSLRRGIRQQFKPREYVQGVSPEDLIRNAQNYSGQTAGYLANTQHYVEKMEARGELDKYMEDNRHITSSISTVHQRVRDALYAKMDTPAESTVETLFNRSANVAMKASLLRNLPGFSYIVQNSTEVAFVGAPMMMDRHGPAKVYGMIGKMYNVFGGPLAPVGSVIRGMKDMYRVSRNQTDLITNYKKYVSDVIDAGIDPALRADMHDFFRETFELGLMDPSVGTEYQRSLYNPAATKAERATDFATNVFQAGNSAIENQNRFVTGASAYLLERQRLGNVPDAHQKAMDYAHDVMYRTNGDYRDWNKPALFNKGPMWRMATQYKQYPQRIIATYIDSAMGALKLTTAEGRANRENWEKGRRLMGMLAVTVGAAGVLGLPTEILKVPLNAAFLLDISPFNSDDAENWFRQHMAREWGAIGRVLSDGFSAVTPVDASQKFSQSNAVFFGAPGSRKPADLMASAFGIITGASGSGAKDAYHGYQLIMQGQQEIRDGASSQGWRHVLQGTRYAMQVRFVADALAAADINQTQATPGGRITREAADPLETAIRAVGFQPTRMTMERSRHDLIKGQADRYMAERNRLVNEWAGAPPAERYGIQKRIDQFNRDYPNTKQRIARDDLLKALGARQKAQRTPAEDLGLPLTARTRPFLQNEPAYGSVRQ